MKSEKKVPKAVRRGIYFSEEDADLIEFIDSQEISASKFVTQLIREKKEAVHKKHHIQMDDISNRELLEKLQQMIGQLEVAPKSPKQFVHEVKSSEELNYSSPIVSLIDDMDDFA